MSAVGKIQASRKVWDVSQTGFDEAKGKPIMSQNTWSIVLVQLLRPNPGRSLGLSQWAALGCWLLRMDQGYIRPH